MIQIKVQCSCGQKYAFDVEPVAGRMPSAVQCPVCGEEGTAAANEMLAQLSLAPAAAPRLHVAGGSNTQERVAGPEPGIPLPPTVRRSPDARARSKWLIPTISASCVVVLGAVFAVWHFQRQGPTAQTRPAPALAHAEPARLPAQASAADALPTLEQTPHRQELEARIAKAKDVVARYHDGHVVIGRVVLDGPGDPRDISAQMEILTDGYFAAETKDLERPIGFRMHGYAPLDLPLQGKKGDLVDVGTLHLTPFPASRLCALTGKITFLGTVDPTKVAVQLSVRAGSLNTPNGGSSPRPHWPAPVPARVDGEGGISATGFSPIEYWCQITGPDIVEKGFPARFTEGQTLDLGTVQVEQAKPIALAYVVAEKRPFDLSQKKEITLRCTAFGTAKLKATADPLRIDLMFEQRNGALSFRSTHQSDLTDLGMGTLEKFANAAPGAGSKPDDVPVRSGHVYLLNHPLWKYQVLFRIELETAASGAEVGSPLPAAETGPPLRWHARTSPVPMQLFGVASGPKHFAAVGFNTNLMLHSPDGADWTALRLPDRQRPTRISFANGRFLTMTQRPESALLESADGVDWKPIHPHDIATNVIIGCFGYADGLYLAAGFGQVLWSADLHHWTAGSGVPRGNIYTLAHGDGRWVGAMDGGSVIASRDGKSWHAVNLADKVSFFGVAYGAGHYVVVGHGGRIFSSADGEHWDQVHEGTDARQGLFGVAFGGDRFVACGFDGAILVSPDGRTWTQSESGTHTILRRVAFGQGRFVIVGDQGTILQSEPVP